MADVAERVLGTANALAGARILVGDDDEHVRALLMTVLGEEGYVVSEADTAAKVLEAVCVPEEQRPELVLLDIRLPEQDGLQILQRMLEQGIDTPVILMTAHSTANLAIRAIQNGAADYLTKPFTNLDVILISIKRVLDYERLKREVAQRTVPVVRHDATERIVGTTHAMVETFKLIGRVARTPATVLITGETGTGKELMAEAVHNASERRNGPLIKVNCAALPETLLESELFGHEKGAFTGALNQHKGRFEAAHKGTIFLDEVGEMSLGTQKKLLRVLQEREFERVGGTAPVKVDVRVVAATNAVLRDEVQAGRFREDLFFRLNVIALHMPPLRERKEDIPALVNHFLDKHRYSAVSIPARISEEAMALLMTYDWPGNVRELENTVQRAVLLSRGELITVAHIVFQNELSRSMLNIEQRLRAHATLADLTAELRYQAARTAMRLYPGDAARASEELGITEQELTTYLEEHPDERHE